MQQGEEVEGAQYSGGEEPRKYAGLKLQSKYRFRIKRVLISENLFNVHGKSGNPERVSVARRCRSPDATYRPPLRPCCLLEGALQFETRLSLGI